jgi:predicted Zn finger-like uncharacterized protein
MIITCPNCASRFNLKDELLGDKGRNVKCAKCSHRWFAAPGGQAPAPKPARAVPAPKPAPPPPPLPPPAPPPPPRPPAPKPAEQPRRRAAPVQADDDDDMDDAPSPPPIPTEEEIARYQSRPEKSRSLLVWWIILFVVIVGIVAAAVGMPKKIVSIYPAANKLYTAVGMPINMLGFGLDIANPTTSTREEGGDRVIVFKGAIKNTTDEVQDVPLLRGALKNAQGKTLFIWTFNTKEPRVLPGESNEYETEIKNPPPGATELNITFTTADEIEAEKEKAREDAAHTPGKPAH